MARRRPTWSTGAPSSAPAPAPEPEPAPAPAPALRKQRHPSLSGIVRDVKDTVDYTFHSYARAPQLGRAHRSALATVLRSNGPALFRALNGRRTPGGFTLSNLIQSDVEASDEELARRQRAQSGAAGATVVPGVAVGDAACWHTFRELLQPLLREVQGVDPADVLPRPVAAPLAPEADALPPALLARKLSLRSTQSPGAPGAAKTKSARLGCRPGVVAGAAVIHVELRAVRNIDG